MKKIFLLLLFLLIFSGCSQIGSKQINSAGVKTLNQVTDNATEQIINQTKEEFPEASKFAEDSCTTFQKFNLIILFLIVALHLGFLPGGIVADIIILISGFLLGWGTLINFVCIPFF